MLDRYKYTYFFYAHPQDRVTSSVIDVHAAADGELYLQGT